MNNCKFFYKVQKAMKPETKRTVIIHRHIFKNAGTTFDSILKNNFGEAFCNHHDDVPMRQEGEKYLISYLNQHPEIKALSSHHIWFKIEPQSQLNLIPVMFLRHPIERIRSVYNFERLQQTDTPGALKAKTANFSEYIKWSMNERVMAVIRNIHTRYLAGYKKVIDLTQEQLSDALKEVEKQKFVGVVDMFDESLRHFDNAFREIGIELDFSYRPKNVAQPYDNADYEIRAQKVLKELGDIADEVMEKNRFDLLVYQAAREKLIPGN
jgi:hypothetical protein